MFDSILEKGLILANQSGFKPGDSCISQLLSITHNIYKSLVFLNISILFDKVWLDGLISNVQENRISGILLNQVVFVLLSRSSENKGLS